MVVFELFQQLCFVIRSLFLKDESCIVDIDNKMKALSCIAVFTLLSVIQATGLIRGYNNYSVQDVMTAKMDSNYDYDVMDNPIELTVVFSDDTDTIEKEHCIVFSLSL